MRTLLLLMGTKNKCLCRELSVHICHEIWGCQIGQQALFLSCNTPGMQTGAENWQGSSARKFWKQLMFTCFGEVRLCDQGGVANRWLYQLLWWLHVILPSCCFSGKGYWVLPFTHIGQETVRLDSQNTLVGSKIFSLERCSCWTDLKTTLRK